MNSPNLDKNEYTYILEVLERRSRHTRRNVLLLIYFVVLTGAFVSTFAFVINKNSNSPLNNAISSAIDFNQNLEEQKNIQKILLEITNNTTKLAETPEKDKISSPIKNSTDNLSDQEVDNVLNRSWLRLAKPQKTTSEKIVETVSAVVISFSVLMFVGFVMRAMLVFIKYYMQLGTDFENQKIAFMLSRGESDGFSKSLSILRNHNISFEKTPNMPQEKILDKIIELTKSVKGDAGKANN
ncbi:hypothetical protein VRB37_16785 [Erwinia billingiae]|uniref:hypothetical protein n=1 Tax=Erwinia billingiae TaxID=182337 RepID=UPI0030D5BC02